MFIQGLEILNFGILVPGDLNFLCVAYLLDMWSISAAGGQMAGFRNSLRQLVRSLNLGDRKG